MKYKQHILKIERPRGVLQTRVHSLRLDKNERVIPFPNEFWKDILSSIRPEHLLALPEVEPLYDDLAKFLSLTRDNIVITPGSDAAIRNIFELFVMPGDKVLILEPTFQMVPVYMNIFSAIPVKIKYNSKLEISLENIFRAINEDVSLLIIANPNSPTGTILSIDIIKDILKLANKKNVPVLIDEAYYGFSKITAIDILHQFPNLIICRTFSKVCGLAGARIGYVLTNKEIASAIYKLRLSYEVSFPSVLFARKILENWKIVEQHMMEVENGKKYLLEKLDQLGKKYIDTYTNFVYIKPGVSLDVIEKKAVKESVLLGNILHIPGYEDFIRISLGSLVEMEKVINLVSD